MNSPAAALPSCDEAERFVYREVRLLDEGRLQEWRELFAEDGVYWAPTRRDQASPDECVSIFLDDRTTMAARIRRLGHPEVHVQTPASHTAHVVSNVEVEAAPERGADFVIHASFVMAEYRQTEPRWYAGRYRYLVRLEGGAPKIVQKKVVLVNCDGAFTAMGVYL